MKKMFILLIILFYTAINIYATDDCSDVTCPDGWNLDETAWLLLQIQNKPDKYCIGKVCYCFKFFYYDDAKIPEIFIKKIVFQDSSCIIHFQYSPIVIKENIIKEIIRMHPNDFDVYLCDHPWGVLNAYTSFCYWTHTSEEKAMIMPCNDTGYCMQAYQYCWDTTKTPWELKVSIFGEPITFNDQCGNFELPPSGISFDHCEVWCK